jgi:hypothetical protein
MLNANNKDNNKDKDKDMNKNTSADKDMNKNTSPNKEIWDSDPESDSDVSGCDSFPDGSVMLGKNVAIIKDDEEGVLRTDSFREYLENVKEFVENTCTENRFSQALDSLYKINPNSKLYNKSIQINHCQDIINWIRDDIIKEEMHTIIDNNFDMRDIIPHLSKKVVSMIKTLI